MAEIEPKTREEKLWNGEDIKPLTREEMYIKHIFDNTQTIPDHPITRKEMLMEKAGEGGGGDITIKQLIATENKTYSEEDTAYSPVIVNVPDVPPVLDELTVTENGTYTPPSGTDGYNEVNVSVQPKLETLTAIENDTYTPSSGKDGFSQVVVNVPPTPLDDLSVTENGTYNPTSGHGFDEVTVNVPLPDNAYLLKSDKDDVVSFNDGSDNFFRTLKAYIEPVQDLHGYDAPWVGGAGKNKLPLSNDYTDTKNNITITVKNGILYVNGTSNVSTTDFYFSTFTLEAGTYILSATKSGTSTNLFLKIGNNYINEGRTFTLNEDSNCSAFLRCYEATYNNASAACMIRLASVQDATFAPYSNECPISGWTGCNINITGFNLWDEKYKNGYYSSNGIYVQSNSSICSQNMTPVYPSTTYYLKTPVGARVCQYKKDGTFISRTSEISNTTFVTNENAYYVTLTIAETTYNNDVCLNVSDASKNGTYEPFGTTYTIQFTDGSNPLTVYGCYVDIVSGLLAVTKVKKTLTSGATKYGSNSVTYANTATDANDGAWCIANYDKSEGSSPKFKIQNGAIWWEGAFARLGISSIEEYNTWNASNSVEVCYELATPQTYQLTPTQVKSLLGENNVWSDTGETEVEYFAKEISE